MLSGRTRGLQRALAAAVRRLDAAGMPYMVIGGIAVLVRAPARLTRDVDITLQALPSAARQLLAVLRPDFRPIPPKPLVFASKNYVLPTEGPGGTHVDFIFAGTGFERAAVDRATVESIGTLRVRVCTSEDLILLKLLAGRPQDTEDVKAIVKAAGSGLDRRGLGRTIAALAESLDRPEIETFWRSVIRRKRRRGS